ncbi:Protein N-acetyltransferase, RimJ/RimL family [Blastococcus aurantiacus]|uniref:Protein N-acetyltransferase, RimJ/RimL family n=1 Tax=Blastococcus aurantiacus TaxID=1550231 RepID=A0A1G7P1K1_9ACTN|nr:GNAT family N-acetyltransferase [Blastococcus aurantiacus]SDF80094.1 Protein N-acetyltransferase, RimJ/RimL family [Blastococcus aurantiacus]
MSTFTTARLRARPVTVDDVPLFERLWADERVGRTLGGVRDRAQVQQALVEAESHWRRWGFGRWLLYDDHGPVGTVKLAHCEIDGRTEVELGYAVLPECWGVGYATEGSAGALEHARDVIGLGEVVAFALVTNAASLAVMRRLGFRHERYLARPAGLHELRRLVLAPA